MRFFVGWVKERSDVPIKQRVHHFAIDALRLQGYVGEGREQDAEASQAQHILQNPAHLLRFLNLQALFIQCILRQAGNFCRQPGSLFQRQL